MVADGACALFEVVLGTEASSWKMQIRLFADSNEIEVEHLVDWHEKHKLAKMEFGMNLVSRELVCDTSAGFIRRETHKNTSWQQARFEVCMHKWCDMAESDGGIAILNDGKYGVGVDENHITLSLLRATIRPDITSDIGKHDFVTGSFHMQETIWMQGSTAGRLNLMYHLKRLPCRSSSTDVSMRSYRRQQRKNTLCAGGKDE